MPTASSHLDLPAMPNEEIVSIGQSATRWNRPRGRKGSTLFFLPRNLCQRSQSQARDRDFTRQVQIVPAHSWPFIMYRNNGEGPVIILLSGSKSQSWGALLCMLVFVPTEIADP